MTPTLELQDTIAVLNLGADENRFSPIGWKPSTVCSMACCPRHKPW